MKWNGKVKLIIAMLTLVALFAAAACMSTKRDCKGNVKHRHPNGFYM